MHSGAGADPGTFSKHVPLCLVNIFRSVEFQGLTVVGVRRSIFFAFSSSVCVTLSDSIKLGDFCVDFGSLNLQH